MKINITTPKTIEVIKLRAVMDVRYWEDGTVNDVEDAEGNLIPCRVGDAWDITIDIATGVIEGWPEGTTADVHYKVCDAGQYSLIGPNGEIYGPFDRYVPAALAPNGDGYGDYVIMNINRRGAIAEWNPEDVRDILMDGDA
jgi:hypothetical protein